MALQKVVLRAHAHHHARQRFDGQKSRQRMQHQRPACHLLVLLGHVRRARVAESRDCGANFLITKPFSAAMLLERVLWVARDTRPFLQVGDYLGPDRRFKTDPYDGHERRADMIRKARFEAEQNEVDQPA